MADPVRLTGLFSMFDTEALISQLTAARQVRVTRLDVQKTTAEARKSAVADLATKFSALLSRANNLVTSTSVSGKSTAVTGTGVTAAASPSATLGSFTVSVGKLATGTTATGSAITAAIDATLPVGSSNFGTTPTDGTYTIKTATGGTKTFTLGKAAADTVSLLSASNFSTAVTSGTFTVATQTGGSAQITIDVGVDSLQDVVNRITAAGVGVTATLTNDANGRANIITLTSVQGDITLTAGTSNFLAASNLSGSAAGATRASTAAFTKQMSLNQVITDINAGGIGVTATITNDANGRANILTLTSAAGAITLGTGGDTSNFLSATGLLASPAGATRSSTVGMARLSTSTKMADASWFGGAPAAGAHTLTINGVSIAYNTANDSLNDVLSRINSSAAGVTARYDALTDTVKLQQTKLGSMAITLADDGAGGNLLSKLGLLAATQVLGTNAEYSIDGGATQYASSNTVVTSGGTTLTFSALIDAGTPATITVSQDSASALTAMKAFVTDFNAAMTAIDTLTKADGSKTGNTSGLLSGDASIRQLKSSLRTMVTGFGVNITGNFSSLGEIGLSFGAVGAAVGSTGTLILDETKFKNALSADPVSVQAILSSYTLTGTLQPGGTGSLSSLSGTYSGSKAGTYAISDDGAGNLTAVFTPVDGSGTTSTTGTIVANGTNATLISGMTLQAGPALQAGTHTITVTATTSSPLRQIKDFLDSQLGASGALTKRQDAYTAISKDIETRKTAMQERIDREMDVLRRKFMLMEQAQARAQAAQSALTQAFAKLTAATQ